MIDWHRKPQRILGNRKLPRDIENCPGWRPAADGNGWEPSPSRTCTFVSPHATAKDEWTAIPANLGRARFGRRLSTAETSRAFGTSRKKMELQTVRFPLLSDCRSHFLHPGPRAVTGVVLRRSSQVHSVRRHSPIWQILYQIVRVFWQKTICASCLEPCEPRKPLLKFMSRLYTYTYSLVYK